jgi:hypothetical protein
MKLDKQYARPTAKRVERVSSSMQDGAEQASSLGKVNGGFGISPGPKSLRERQIVA